MSEDPCWKCFLQCTGLKLNIFSSDGDTDIKRVVQTFNYVDIPLVQKCASITAPDPCQRAYLFVKCNYDEVVKRFPL